jgi:hypothetical protein
LTKFSELGDESNRHGLQAAGYGQKNGFQGTSMAYSNWSFYYIHWGKEPSYKTYWGQLWLLLTSNHDFWIWSAL